MAIKLKQAGYDNFTIFEKAKTIGGTWRDNTYPGLACDVPSHLYSYSFELNPDWSHAYSPGWEIQDYCQHCTDKYNIRSHVLTGSEVKRCVRRDGKWHISTADDRAHTADVLISAMGGLHHPKYPDIPGRDTFCGISFHSSRWQETKITGKRVAIIGSAASAVQILPQIAGEAASVCLFQRTPNWIIPRRDRAYGKLTRWCFRHVPGLARAYRWLLFLTAEARWPAFRADSLANRLGRWLGIWHLRRQVADKTLRAKLTPDYPVGCKRILRSDDFYPALQRENVELLTDGIDRIESDAVVTKDGTRHVVDVIIYATGFDVFHITGGTEFVGSHGQSLGEHWHERIAAHRTVTVPGFANFFMLQGPNSALGHNSVIFMIESQVRYIIECLARMRERGWSAIAPKVEAFEAYDKALMADLDKMIWPSGCNSWYQDAKGRVFTLWPRTCTRYWFTMRRPDMREYQPAD